MFSWVHGWVGAQRLYEELVLGITPPEWSITPSVSITPEIAKEWGYVSTFGRPPDMDEMIANKESGKFYTIGDMIEGMEIGEGSLSR